MGRGVKCVKIVCESVTQVCVKYSHDGNHRAIIKSFVVTLITVNWAMGQDIMQ